MNIVLFLGAGFSAAWDLPVMDRFFDVADAHPRLTAEQKKFLRAIWQEAKSADGTIGAELNDLEHVLSFALMARNIENLSDESEPIGDQLRKILAVVYGDITQGIKTKKLDSLTKLLGFKDSSWAHKVTVITTNYDLIAETMFRPFGISVYLPTPWISHTNYRNHQGSLYGTDHPGAVCLCKLHGSVNWYETDPKDDDKFLIADKKVLGQYYDNHDEMKQIVLPEICAEQYAPPSCPILVPPTLPP